MSDVDEIIRCALRVKNAREEVNAAEQELAAAMARHRGGHPRSSTKHSVRDGTRLKAVARDARPKTAAREIKPEALAKEPQTEGAPTSVSGRVREHMRANSTKTYDSAALMAELQLPKKALLNVRALLKTFTKQKVLVRVKRGQYRWRA